MGYMKLCLKKERKKKENFKTYREIIGPTFTWSFWYQEILVLLAMNCLS